VHVRGRSGLFLVVWVDFHGRAADLVPLDDNDVARLEEGVPFKELQPYKDERELEDT
jgi:hypothetical protein